MKKIIKDKNENIFWFDGKTVEPLGKSEAFKELWTEIIFQIGEDIYYKKDGTYKLLAEKAQFYSFGEDQTQAIGQFSKLGKHFLFTQEGITGFKELPAKFAPLFKHNSKDDSEIKENGFILVSQLGHQIYKLNKNNVPQLCSDEIIAIPNSDCFFWNGYFYGTDKNGNVGIKECGFLYAGETYLLFDVCKYAVALFENKTITCNGVFKSIEKTQVSDILVAGETDYLHLGSDFIERIVSTYYDKMSGEDFYDSASICSDGKIHRSYSMALSHYDPTEYFDETYDLVDGHYKKINNN